VQDEKVKDEAEKCELVERSDSRFRLCDLHPVPLAAK
jgi:hypothetical protein